MTEPLAMTSSLRWPKILVGLGLAAYTVWWSWFTIAKAHNFNSGFYDLGIMTQTVWNVGHGRGFVFNNPEAGPGGRHGLEVPRTAVHTDFLLALLGPISWLGRTAETLLIVQSAVLAAGAWFVFSLAQRLLGRPWLSVFLAYVYLLYPPLNYANLFEFHAVTLSVTLFLAAAEAIVAGRHQTFWVWASLALLTKEQVGLTLGLMAGALYFRRREPRRAWLAWLIPWAWVALQFLAVIPLSRPAQDTHFVYAKFYQAEGASPTEVLQTFAHPRLLWAKLATAAHAQTALQLLRPVGFLSILSPLTYLAAPEPLIYWLADSRNLQTAYFHYHALIIPFVFVGLILSLGWLERLGRRLGTRGSRWVVRAAMVLIVLGSAESIRAASPWPWSGQSRWNQVTWRERQAPQIREALTRIPARAAVAATDNLGPFLAERPVFQLLPNGVTEVEYIAILERKFDPNISTNDKRRAEQVMIERLLAWMRGSPAFQELYGNGRVHLFRRIGRVTEAEPAWPAGLPGQ